MPISPQWMDLYQIWFRGFSRERNQLCGILLQSAHGFRFCEGSKFAISHWLGRSPLTQCWRYRAACDDSGGDTFCRMCGGCDLISRVGFLWHLCCVIDPEQIRPLWQIRHKFYNFYCHLKNVRYFRYIPTCLNKYHSSYMAYQRTVFNQD